MSTRELYEWKYIYKLRDDETKKKNRKDKARASRRGTKPQLIPPPNLKPAENQSGDVPIWR